MLHCFLDDWAVAPVVEPARALERALERAEAAWMPWIGCPLRYRAEVPVVAVSALGWQG